MADRYWVGGAGTWNTSSTANWSASPGGASGASVPTSADNVFFDQAGTYTVTMTGALTCLDITVSLGAVTFATGTTPTLAINGSMSLIAGTVWSSTGTVTFNATTTGKTVTTNGTTLSGAVTFNGVGGYWTLGSALTSISNINLNAGTLDTSSSSYAVTCGTLSPFSSSNRSLLLNASTITVTGFISSNTNFTLNAGTSTITITSATPSFTSDGLTFYNVIFTNVGFSAIVITGVNTFNTLSLPGTTNFAVSIFEFNANQTIGTLTLNPGVETANRKFLRSDTIGTTRTLAVTTLPAGAANYDFRDIAITGAAAPLTGTNFGDAKGNSGITFPAAKTVYWGSGGSGFWGVSGGNWSLTNGGAVDITAFPLAQDTAVFPNAIPPSGATVTVNAGYNIGTIDMSLRTTNTMTLTTGPQRPIIYGNWVNGTGITLSGTSFITFSGRGSQTITSAGKTFAQSLTIDTPGGSVTLQDNFVSSGISLTLTSGTFNANNYSVTVPSFSSNNSNVRTVAIGSGIWTLSASGTVWNVASIPNFTAIGTGTINLIAATAKTFAGGGVQTYPTINQGGAGALTVTGSNKFANITNTYSATGATSVLFVAGFTNRFTAFNLTGAIGNVCTLGSTTAAQTNLIKFNAWYMGANSTNGGNNTGLVFTAGGGIDYLSVSYINGTFTTLYAVDVAEVSTGADVVAALAPQLSEVAETITGADLPASIVTSTSTVSEAVTVSDVFSGSFILQNAAVEEFVTASDVFFGAYLWDLIPNYQDPNWGPVNNTQSITWSNVGDSQTPNWQNVDNA